MPNRALSRYVCGLILILLSSGCGNEEPRHAATSPGYSVTLPSRIQPRALSGDCSENLNATITLDNQAPVSMDRDGEAFSWSARIEKLDLGEHRFRIAFTCTTTAYGTLVLARADKAFDLVEGNNDIEFADNDFTYPGKEDDGISNLAAIESGVNPLPASNIDLIPAIVKVVPGNGSTGVGRSNEVSITFSEDVLAESVTEDSFYLSAGGDRVAGQVTFDAGTNTASFTPEIKLALLTEYTATVMTAVKDTGNAPLFVEEVLWRFTTADGEWQVIEKISSNDNNNGGQSISADAIGNAIVAWSDGSSILSRNFNNENSSWGEIVRADDEENPAGKTGVVVAMSSQGKSALAWNNFYYRSWNACVPGNCFEALSDTPKITINTKGDILVAWNHYRPGGRLDNVYFSDIMSSRLSYRYTLDGWEVPQSIENSIQSYATISQLISDNQGNSTAIWTEGTDNNDITNIFSNRFVNNSWGQTQVMLNVAGESGRDPQVVADDKGNLVAIWMQASKLWSNQYSIASDSWGEANIIYTGNENIGQSKISMDRQNNAVVAWLEGNNIYAMRYSAFWNHWEEPRSVGGDGATEVGNPQVRMDSAGNALVVWNQYTDAEQSHSDIWANRFMAVSGTWSGPGIIENKSGKALEPKMSMTPGGEAFVVWEGDGEIYATQFK